MTQETDGTPSRLHPNDTINAQLRIATALERLATAAEKFTGGTSTENGPLASMDIKELVNRSSEGEPVAPDTQGAHAVRGPLASGGDGEALMDKDF